jgi:hypothetical protein
MHCAADTWNSDSACLLCCSVLCCAVLCCVLRRSVTANSPCLMVSIGDQSRLRMVSLIPMGCENDPIELINP